MLEIRVTMLHILRLLLRGKGYHGGSYPIESYLSSTFCVLSEISMSCCDAVLLLGRRLEVRQVRF